MEINVDKRLYKRSGSDRLDIKAAGKPVNVTASTVTVTGDLALTGDQTLTGDNTFVGDQAITGDVDVTGDVGVVQASAEAGAEFVMKHKQIEHTTDSGTGVETLAAAIPANSYVVGVHGKIKTAISGTSLTDFDVGVTGDANRFVTTIGALTKNTAFTPADHAAEAVGVGRYYNTATDILLTATAGQFDAGSIVIDIYYFDLSPCDNFA